MNLTNAAAIKELLEKYGAKPSKTMGQNFLVNEGILNKIMEASQVKPTDTILEIGPGIGTLTQALAAKSKHVIAVEKDRGMVKILQETLAGFKNVQVLQKDALKDDYALPEKYKVIANIPYYITSPIIRKFLEAPQKPEVIILMIQKEVAQRICAVPPNMSILAVSVQFYASAKIVSTVSKECFWPAPKIDSAIIKITPNVSAPAVDPDTFFSVVKAGFLHPRKQLANNLGTVFKKNKEEISHWLVKNNINPLQRAETLAISDWICLTQTLDVVK